MRGIDWVGLQWTDLDPMCLFCRHVSRGTSFSFCSHLYLIIFDTMNRKYYPFIIIAHCYCMRKTIWTQFISLTTSIRRLTDVPENVRDECENMLVFHLVDRVLRSLRSRHTKTISTFPFTPGEHWYTWCCCVRESLGTGDRLTAEIGLPIQIADWFRLHPF